jgi:Bacterial regulatory proteins, gntR family/Periplasmic binding protein-like domain
VSIISSPANPEKSAGEEETGSLSYKFQRLRERLRDAINSGDLSGKLPGERALAKRFHVNAKTLSKALTDLAAEGLLDRSIGRGTYVKGSAPAVATAKRWLVVVDQIQAESPLADLLRKAHPDLDVMTDVSMLRPSVLNQFSAVIVLSNAVPDSFIRDLVVRNVAVVAVGDEPRAFSTHAVLSDLPLAISQVTRDLLLAGHTHLAAVGAQTSSNIANLVRQAAARFGSAISVESCSTNDPHCLVDHAVTAFVCESVSVAMQVKETLEKRQIRIPGDVSVVAVGCQTHANAISGYYTSFSEKADAILTLLQQNSARPTTIWLAGKYFDCGTMSPLTPALAGEVLAGLHGAAI